MLSSLIFIIVISNAVKRVHLQAYDERIVGGNPTSVLFFPYHLGLLYQETYQCGASLITPIGVITGAHCVLRSPQNLYTIRAGTSLRNFGGLLVNVQRIVTHPQFNRHTMDYDVAILILRRPLSLSPKIIPIGLPEMYENPLVGTKAVVSGWGLTNPYDSNSGAGILRSVDVQIMDQSSCRVFFGSNAISNRMLCAGYRLGGKDACQGDSGGPLVQNGKLIGIVSWGIDCAQPFYPGIYTRTSQVRTFIRQYAGV